MTHKPSHRPVLRALFTTLASLLFLSIANAGGLYRQVTEPGVFSKCWDYGVEPNLGVGIAADGSHAYVMDAANELHAIDRLTGVKVWSSELGGDVISNLLVLNDLLFLVTNSQPDTGNPSGKAVIRALSRHTGVTSWQEEIISTPIVWIGSANGSVTAVQSNGFIASWVPKDGTSRWRTTLSAGVTSDPYFHTGGIDLGTQKNEVVRVSGESGQIQVLWKSRHLPTAILSNPGGRLLVGDDRGNLTAVSEDRDRLWRFKNGAQISSASIYQSDYLAASFDNFVYKLSRSGDVKWKRRLSGRVTDRPIVLGDTAVVSIVGSGSVYALDLRNGKILNRIETGDEVSLRVAAANSASGFVVANPRGLSYYDLKCPAK